MEPNVKTLTIATEPKHTKKINCEKEKKMRVETKTWGLTEEELLHQTQINIIKNIATNIVNQANQANQANASKNETEALYISHIKTKISGYKQQDILKKKLNESLLVSFEEVIQLLEQCDMKCHYCSQEVYILYERVREMKQWSLDRINNDIGHNSGNLIVACLECNLKRRRTNKDAFMFTKNMVITRDGI